MSASEFINESINTKAPVERRVTAPLPGVYVQPELRNNDAYRQYRYGVALAGARAADQKLINLTDESELAGHLVHVGYTAEDEETIRLASAAMCVKNLKISDTPSLETNDTNTVSAVPAFKKNKYGV